MTAINVFRGANAVHICTDGAVFGKNPSIGPKVFTAPHLPAIIATRGEHSASTVIGNLVTALYSSFDEIEAKLETVFPAMHLAYRHRTGHSDNDTVKNTDVILAGWSERRQEFASYFIRSYDRDDGGPPAHQLTALPPITCGPALLGVPLISLENDDAMCRGMVSIMESQRKEFGFIGGFAQLTSLTRQGITQRILHRWA